MKEKNEAALLRRRESDDGDASIVTSLFLLPLVFFLLISAIDVGMYFSSEAHLSNAARNGSNVTSTLGAVGTESRMSRTERAYSGSASTDDLDDMSGRYDFSVDNTPEYVLMTELEQSSSLYHVDLEDVTCTVDGGESSNQVREVGDRPSCTIDWKYDGLPLSFWGFIQTVGNDGEIEPRETTASAASDLLVSDRDNRDGWMVDRPGPEDPEDPEDQGVDSR